MQSVFTFLNVLQGNWNDRSILVSVNATQCALSYCINRYSGHIVNNTFQEVITDTFYNDTSYNTTTTEYTEYPPSIIRPDENFTRGITNVTDEYAVSYQVWVAMAMKLNKIWNGFGDCDVFRGLDTSDTATVTSPLDYGGIVNATRSLAESMATAMRKVGDEQDASGSNADSRVRVVYGETSHYVPYVVVEWRRMILSASMLVLTLAFLLLTIKNNDQNDILWRDTSLAVFYQPLASNGRDGLQSA